MPVAKLQGVFLGEGGDALRATGTCLGAATSFIVDIGASVTTSLVAICTGFRPFCDRNR